MRRAVPVHYLRPNEAEWTPPVLISFDTESLVTETPEGEVHILSLWSARLSDRRAAKGRQQRDDQATGESAEDFAHQVHAWCSAHPTTWMYAHNLHYDLSVTGLVAQLGRLGWQVTDFAVDGASPFVRFCRGRAHLTVTDSWSWLPVPLTAVGAALNMTKPPLPATGERSPALQRRCDADRDIVHQAMLTLMAWWDERGLGRWTITGAASGWNAMRHTPAPRKILIDPDPDRSDFGRSAIYGGRRYCWRAGSLAPGTYMEVDFERAYTTVARDLPLPCERLSRFDSLPLDHAAVRCERLGAVAWCDISTDVPRYPVRSGGRVWYPVGRFWTILAGPDIAAAAKAGDLVAIGPGWIHKLGHALRPWATWVLHDQADDGGTVPEVAKIALKSWGRSVIGKWGQRSFERIPLGVAPTQEWSHCEAWHHGSNTRASIVDFGGTRWQVTSNGEPENAYPEILAFVEAHVRVRLNAMAEIFGASRTVCCDTDGLIARDVTPPLLAQAARACWPLIPRRKHTYHSITVTGPQHMVIDGQRRMSGVPGSAQPTGDGRLCALLWPKLAWQMAHGTAGTYTRPAASYRLSATHVPGWIATNGEVLPVEAYSRGDRATTLAPWQATFWHSAGWSVAENQNPALLKAVRNG